MLNQLSLEGLKFLAWQQGKALDYAGIKSLTDQRAKSIVKFNYLGPNSKLLISDLLENKTNNSILKINFEDVPSAIRAWNKFKDLGKVTKYNETIYELSRNNQKMMLHQVGSTVYLLQIQNEVTYKAYLEANK